MRVYAAWIPARMASVGVAPAPRSKPSTGVSPAVLRASRPQKEYRWSNGHPGPSGIGKCPGKNRVGADALVRPEQNSAALAGTTKPALHNTRKPMPTEN